VTYFRAARCLARVHSRPTLDSASASGGRTLGASASSSSLCDGPLQVRNSHIVSFCLPPHLFTPAALHVRPHVACRLMQAPHLPLLLFPLPRYNQLPLSHRRSQRLLLGRFVLQVSPCLALPRVITTEFLCRLASHARFQPLRAGALQLLRRHVRHVQVWTFGMRRVTCDVCHSAFREAFCAGCSLKNYE
jgi:hypothetical protein